MKTKLSITHLRSTKFTAKQTTEPCIQIKIACTNYCLGEATDSSKWSSYIKIALKFNKITRVGCKL